MKDAATPSFIPSWSNQPHIEGGCFLPIDNGTRTPYPEIPPQSVLDIAKATYGQVQILNSSENALFHPFPKLPIELRRRIWWYSLPGPRVVEIFLEDDKCKSYEEKIVALHVCRESRESALEVYKLAFKTVKASATTYFDFDVDILYMGAGNLSNHPLTLERILKYKIDRRDLGLVRHVAVDNDFSCSLIWPCDGLLKPVNSSIEDEVHLRGLFPAMESFTSVVIPSASGPSGPTRHHAEYPHDFDDYSADIVIAADSEASAEFRPWIIESNGSVLPWKLPLGPVTWEALISEIWRCIEYFDKPGVSCKGSTTIRFVPLEKLGRAQTWRPRSDYVNGCIYFGEKRCIFEATEELRKLFHLREHDSYLYKLFGCRLARRFTCSDTSERLTKIKPMACIDPIKIYRYTQCCDCAVEHNPLDLMMYIRFRLRLYNHSFELDQDFDIKEEMKRCTLWTS